MTRFEQLCKKELAEFAEDISKITAESDFCNSQDCPYLSVDNEHCRSSNCSEDCVKANANYLKRYLSTEVDEAIVPENNGSVLLAILVGIVAVAVMAVALLIR